MSRHSNPERLGILLDHLLAEAETSYCDEAHQLWEVWPRAVGPDVARRTTPKHFHLGVLTVAVASSPWLHQLSLLQEQILEALARELGTQVVRELRFRLGTLADLPPPPAPDIPLPTLRPEQEAAIDEEVAILTDPDLREAVRRARVRSARESLRETRAEGMPPRNSDSPKRARPGKA